MEQLERELKMVFLEDAQQLLADAEVHFVALEKASHDPTVIIKIFRLAHNLKGSAGAVSLEVFGHLCHQLESLLTKIKSQEIQIDSDVISLLLKCNDRLCLMVKTLKQNLEAQFENQDLLQEIHQYIPGESLDASTLRPDSTSREQKERQLQEALAAAENKKMAELTQITAASLKTEISPLHTDLPQVARLSDQESDHVSAHAGASSQDESLRVNSKKLDVLIHTAGELVILQSMLAQHCAPLHSKAGFQTLVQMIGKFEKVSREIQDIACGLRMIPVRQTFQKMQRVVRDTSHALQKDVQLVLVGEDTELDRSVLERVSDPLVHLMRNAVDHGLEPSAEDRTRSGKAAQGRIELSAFYRGGKVVIEVRDDGVGMDAERLMSKALEKGLIQKGDVVKSPYHLIFLPGFSTKEQVTDISGRGVGMDIVKANIAELRGEIEIETELGKGTCFRMLLPMTLAVIEGLIVFVGKARFVVPIVQIAETYFIQEGDLKWHLQGSGNLHFKGELLPAYCLSNVLEVESHAPDQTPGRIALVVRPLGHPAFAVIVHDILLQQQVLIKHLGAELEWCKGVTGGAVLKDGRIALILDLFELIEQYKLQLQLVVQPMVNVLRKIA
jgi:two-component system chemotaxis sensor kinase CheA